MARKITTKTPILEKSNGSEIDKYQTQVEQYNLDIKDGTN